MDHHLPWHLYLSAYWEQQHVHHQYQEGEVQEEEEREEEEDNILAYNWKPLGMDYTEYILV